MYKKILKMTSSIIKILLSSLLIINLSIGYVLALTAEDVITRDNGSVIIREDDIDNISEEELYRINQKILYNTIEFINNNSKNSNRINKLNNVITKQKSNNIIELEFINGETPILRDNINYILKSDIATDVADRDTKVGEIFNSDTTDNKFIFETDGEEVEVSEPDKFEDINSFSDVINVDDSIKTAQDENSFNDSLIKDYSDGEEEILEEVIFNLNEGEDFDSETSNNIIEGNTIITNINPNINPNAIVVDDTRLGDINIGVGDERDNEIARNNYYRSGEHLLASVVNEYGAVVYDATGNVVNLTEAVVPTAPVNIPMTPIKRNYITPPFVNESFLIIAAVLIIIVIYQAYKQGSKIRKMEEKFEKRQMFLFRDEADNLQFDDYSSDKYSIK